MSNLETMKLGELIAEYERLLNQRDEVRQQEKQLNKQIQAVQKKLTVKMKDDDLDTAKFGNTTVRLEEKFVPLIEDWDTFLRSVVENDQTFLIQRRIAASRLKTLIDDGVDLPEGVDFDYIDNLKHTRRKA